MTVATLQRWLSERGDAALAQHLHCRGPGALHLRRSTRDALAQSGDGVTSLPSQQRDHLVAPPGDGVMQMLNGRVAVKSFTGVRRTIAICLVLSLASCGVRDAAEGTFDDQHFKTAIALTPVIS